MRVAETAVSEIKNRLSIVDVVSSYLPVVKKGKDSWVVCPFHSDKNPSMKLSEDRGTYYCFGCKASGDIFSFVMNMDNVEFSEALKKLADMAGVQLEEQTEATTRAVKEKTQIENLYALLNKNFVANLHEAKSKGAKEALDYIQKRGFSEETVRNFSLGYAPDDWDFVKNFAHKNGFNDYILKKSGLLSQRGYSHFVDRITFPIINRSGKVVAFSARTMKKDDKTAKYINSGESPIFSKKDEFFGFYQAADSLRAGNVPVICEGNFDVMALHQSGITSALATCGTALSKNQCSILRRYNDKVKTFFDSDDAGRIATLKALPMLKSAGMSPSVVLLPKNEAKDPSEFMHLKGSKSLVSIVNKSINGFAYAVKVLSLENDISTMAGKRKVMDGLKPIIDSTESNVEKTALIKKVCSTLALDVESSILDYNLDKEKQERTERYRESFKKRREDNAKEDSTIWDKSDDLPLYETDLMKCLFYARRIFKESRVLKRINYKNFRNPKAAAIYSYLSERVPLDIDASDEVFLANIEDEGMREYLRKSKKETEVFINLSLEEQERQIEEAVDRIKLRSIKDDSNFLQKTIEIGADTTMSTGFSALREKQNMNIEYQELSTKLRGGMHEKKDEGNL